VYLLELYANSSNSYVRTKAAELFAKMFSDKLVGPRIRILLGRFLPAAFLDAMRDSPEGAVHLFESTHENPELIWTEEARRRVCDAVKHLKDSFYAQQRADPEGSRWTGSSDVDLVKEALGDRTREEVIIGGVYLRLFVQNPGWGLRKPREFLIELFESWTRLTQEEEMPSVHNYISLSTQLYYLLLSGKFRFHAFVAPRLRRSSLFV